MTLAVALASGIAALLTLLATLQFAPIDHQKWPRLRALERRRLHLAGAAVAALLLSIVMGVFNSLHSANATEITNGKGRVDLKVTRDAAEMEIQGSASDRSQEAVRFFRSGDDLLAAHEYEAAAAAYRQSLDRVPSKAALINLSIALRYLSDLGGSIEAAGRALALKTSVDPARNDGLNANAMLQMGTGLSSLGKKDEAQAYLRQALERFSKLGDRLGQAAAEYEIALAAYRRGDTASALRLFRSAEERFEKGTNLAGQANSLNALGVVNLDLGNHAIGLEYLQRAVVAFRSLNDPSGEAGTLLNVGTTQQDKCDLTSSLQSYSEAVTVAKKAKNLALAALAQANIASAYVEMGNFDEAWKNAASAIQMCNGITAPESEGWANLYAATADIRQKNFERARQEIGIARAKLEQTNPIGRIAVAVEEARIWAGEQQRQQSDDAISRALKLAADGGFATAKVEILVASAEILMARDDTPRAKEALQAARAVCAGAQLAECDCQKAETQLAQLK